MKEKIANRCVELVTDVLLVISVIYSISGGNNANEIKHNDDGDGDNDDNGN